MNSKDSAVSPVVGVLLMLVVTIIIAAIVSGFAGGISGTQQKAPTASFDVKTQYPITTSGGTNSAGFDLFFTHRGGDTINTKNTQIITLMTLPNGSMVRHVTTPTSVPAWQGSGDKYTRYPYFRDSMGSASQTITQAQYTAGTESPVWWGQVSVSTGQAVRVSGKAPVAVFLGLVEPMMPYDATAYATGIDLLNQSIANKSSIEVKWMDIPSQKSIFEKTFSLEG